MEILERGLKVKEYELKRENFSDSGAQCSGALARCIRRRS